MEDICRVQEKAKNERQNDDYATADTNPNSSSLNDKAHHVRRRLSQTITSRYCLLIAIALALPSAHACSDTVELQVTCDSGKATWVVLSSDAIYESTTVTVGSCIDGRVADIARVERKDIDGKGIVICSQPTVCYHLKRQSGDQIEAKNCDNYDDPNRTYYCDNGVLKFRNDKSHDITASDTCFSSNNESHNYGCNGNELTQIHCPNGCADDHKGCKPNPDLSVTCTADGTLMCKGEALFECRKGTYIEVGKACNDKGEVVFCDGNELKPEKHTCADGKVVWCRKDESGKYRLHTSDCYPNPDIANIAVCNPEQSTNTCTRCSSDGKCMAPDTDADQIVRCKEDLTGITPYTGTIKTGCQYCYNESIENDFASIGELGCKGCVPNEYTPRDGTVSTLNPKDEVCYNGKLVKFDDAIGGDFILFPQSDGNGLWEFALNVTVALPEGQSPNPPANQFQTFHQRTWQYYNCHNDAMKFSTKQPEVNNVNDFLEFLNNSNKCCQDVNSYYITQTGYRYYSVEKCTNIALYNTSNVTSRLTNFSAYAYTPELNDFLIGTEHDLLAKDYACLEAKNNLGDTNDVRRMMFIKQKTDGDQQSRNGELKHGIYKAFECLEDYKCDDNPNRLLCISNDNSPQSCNKFKCDTNNIIYCNIDSNQNMIVAKCPEGTTLHIVGDSGQSICEDQSSFTLDQVRCVPDSQSTSE